MRLFLILCFCTVTALSAWAQDFDADHFVGQWTFQQLKRNGMVVVDVNDEGTMYLRALQNLQKIKPDLGAMDSLSARQQVRHSLATYNKVYLQFDKDGTCEYVNFNGSGNALGTMEKGTFSVALPSQTLTIDRDGHQQTFLMQLVNDQLFLDHPSENVRYVFKKG